MRVVFTPLAERQMDRLHAYISTRSGTARADGFVSRILDFCEGLTTFPKRGTCRDDLLPGLRILGFERNVTIAFIVGTTTVLIEGIYYGGQDHEAHYRGD